MEQSRRFFKATWKANLVFEVTWSLIFLKKIVESNSNIFRGIWRAKIALVPQNCGFLRALVGLRCGFVTAMGSATTWVLKLLEVVFFLTPLVGLSTLIFKITWRYSGEF